MTAGPWGRRRGFARWPFMLWMMLPLLGCGATLQAEDTAATATLKQARQLYDSKQYGAARDKAAQIATKSPENPQALYLRALANVQLGEYAVAREDLEKAKQIDPLLVFAKNKQEFDRAWATARDNTMAALGPQEVTTPPEPDAKAAQAPPPKPDVKRPVGPDPKQSQDPAVKALAGSGAIHDVSGKAVVGEPQRKSMAKAVSNLKSKGLDLRLLVLAPGKDAEAEAKRLFEAARLADQALLVVGVPGGKVAAYHPLLTPDVARAEVADALATAGDASLPRRMILAATALGVRLQAPPAMPEPAATDALEPASSAPAPPAPASTAPPSPAPSGPPSGPLGSALAGVLAGVLLWAGLNRLLARRRLARGFGQAGPQVTAVAERLGAVLQRLMTSQNRTATAAQAAAELAYFEGLAMFAEARADRTGDIARVERAGRLLDEAAAKLDEAEASLAADPGRPPRRVFHCYFTGRPLLDRFDGDLIELRWRGESRRVLVARAVGDRIRRGEVPAIRVVKTSEGLVHWARAEGYDPARDLYQDDRFGRELRPAADLREAFFDDPDGRVFVDLGDRPDYQLDLGGGAAT